ncbi:MAG: DHH family phosphoesterase [Candidatus Peribacteraceae bacterium]|nr:DHH family phosphoesterase [Candidatus Peribacteraceae bacterium]
MSLSSSELAAASKAVQEHQRILVIPHANVDPDGLSSALACYEVFRALGKDVTVVCPDTLPESLNFLPGFEKLSRSMEAQENFVITINLEDGMEVDKLRYTVEDKRVNIIVVPKSGRIHRDQITLSEGDAPYDLIVVVDTADLPLLGSLYTEHIDVLSSVPILNIDHHISNTKFGQLQLIDPTAASATEVLYHWFLQDPALRKTLTADTATLLLTGLITDTRSFQNPNTTPRSLEVAAELLELGARQQEIIKNIYKTKPLSTLRIWGRALNRIQIDTSGGIVWSTVSREDLAEMGAGSKETHGLLDELISTIPDADVHVLFTELEEGEGGLKASMRSSPAINVSKLAAETYGGGGHARAAGFRIKRFSNFDLQVLECIQKLRDGIAAQRETAQAPRPVPPASQAKAPQEPKEESAPDSPLPSAKPKTRRKKELDVVGDVAPRSMEGGDSGDIMQELTSGA